MKRALMYLSIAAVLALVLIVAGDYFLRDRTTKIDEQVSLVTLDEYVIVMQRGETPRVTRVKPAAVPPKNMRVPPDPKQPDAPRAPAIPKWTLPYSCSDVRYYNSHFTKGQLEAMRVAAGMAMPSADQRAQIQACLAGKVK